MDYQKEYEQLKKRFDHLMQSEFIAGFDRWDSVSRDYVRDIKLADEMGFGKSCKSSLADLFRCEPTSLEPLTSFEYSPPIAVNITIQNIESVFVNKGE